MYVRFNSPMLLSGLWGLGEHSFKTHSRECGWSGPKTSQRVHKCVRGVGESERASERADVWVWAGRRRRRRDVTRQTIHF